MNSFDCGHIKILFRTDSEAGYPPEEWEGIWAKPIDCSTAEIDNIPFYAKEVSCNDIVSFETRDNEYFFKQVIVKSPNSTIRVIIYNLNNEAKIRTDLINFGCAIEGTGTPGLLAINIPSKALKDVGKYLDDGLESDMLDFEEGAIR